MSLVNQPLALISPGSQSIIIFSREAGSKLSVPIKSQYDFHRLCLPNQNNTAVHALSKIYMHIPAMHVESYLLKSHIMPGRIAPAHCSSVLILCPLILLLYSTTNLYFRT